MSKENTQNKVPLVDLKAQHQIITEEINTAIQSVLNDSAFVGTRGNDYVKRFEEEFASYIGSRHCVGCGNGTDAIEIALKALGIKSGDEVIVPALTWIATSEAVTNCGGKPVFVDIDPKHYTIDPDLIEKAITSKTKAIIPVHLYGKPARIDKIMKIASLHNLLVIEDCAQAHGAEYKGRKVGTFGNMSTFSFFPSKNLGAYGDAGAVVTNDEDLANKVRMIANHGQPKKNEHLFEGRNSRLDGIQAAVLSVKLKHLDSWNYRRIEIASIYSKKLSDKITVPTLLEDSKPVYHLYVIGVENRNTIRQKLERNGVETGIHYPAPLPLLEAYKYLGLNHDDFKNAISATQRIISLPMYPELTDKQIEFVIEIVNKTLESEL